MNETQLRARLKKEKAKVKKLKKHNKKLKGVIEKAVRKIYFCNSPGCHECGMSEVMPALWYGYANCEGKEVSLLKAKAK